MASLVDMLNASDRGGESDGFLNDLVAQLWPNINVAGCRMAKEIVEPMFASMLPGPLASLHFTKMDLGTVPLKVDKVDVIRTENGGVDIGMDVSWHSKSDFQLDGKMIPDLGIDRIHLTGRLSVLLSPLTNILPCFSAAQIAFINRPKLDLDFTGAAEIADSWLINKTVRKAIMETLCSMAVLPNRYLYKLDTNADWFQAYCPHIGVLRLTVEKATGLEYPKNSDGATGKIEGLLKKVGLKDIPDPFVNVTVGAGPTFRSKTKKNNMHPVWDETHDFLVADFDQDVVIEVMDEDPGENDPMGVATVSVKQLLLGGPQAQDLPVVREDLPGSHGKVAVRAKFLHFIADPSALSAAAQDAGEGEIIGLATVLIASALNLQGNRDALKPNVKVVWGTDPKQVFNTTTQSYYPGYDIFNPSFDQAFRFPITKKMLANPPGFEITLMNGTEEKVGSVELPFEEVLNAEGCLKGGKLDVGEGVQVRAQIFIRGLQLAR